MTEEDKNAKRGALRLSDVMKDSSALRINDFRSDEYIDAARLALSGGSLAEFEAWHRELSSREKLRSEIVQLETQIRDTSKALSEANKKGAQARQEKEQLQQFIKELEAKNDLGFLLGRVGHSAQQLLIQDEAFRKIFAENSDCQAFVMSVDIRRSTELMLKARSPGLFAEFLSKLTKELFRCVIENGGVFDKFTGDGILAFFPENFCGEDYGYRAVKAAQDCHDAFEKAYLDSRRSFSAVLNGIGLGIGIDHGTVRLLRAAEGLTVVGVPVVYACRLSGAEPKHTLLNQPAYEVLSDKYGKQLKINESSLHIKHEGEILAYDVSLGHEVISAKEPFWLMRKVDS